MKLTKPLENMTLQEMFLVVMTQYREVKGTTCGSSNPIWAQWRDLKTEMIKNIMENSGLDFANSYISDLNKSGVASNLGSGKWAEVFGFSVRHNSVTSTQKGVYITYLFNQDTGCAYLTLSQGASEYGNNPKRLAARVQELREQLNLAPALTAPINTGKPAYDAGVIASKEYTPASLPDDATLYQDLKDMVQLYEQYLNSEAPVSYTDSQLCEILDKMINDGNEISRKNAALAVFGAVYGGFIHKGNKELLLDVTARTGTRSNELQLYSGTCLYKLAKNNPGLDLFEVLDVTAATAEELHDLLEAEHAAASAGAKEATAIHFGIRYSKTIEGNNLKKKDIYNDGGLIGLGCQIVDFLEKFPQYGTMQSVDAPYQNKYADILLQSKNIIFRGAPGTGKTYLAREIAAILVSDGAENKYKNLTKEQKKQVEFVQFHPSYDYSDFVEGLRPKLNPDGSMGFALRDGIFKQFANKAKANFENSRKTKEILESEVSAQAAIDAFLSELDFDSNSFKLTNGNAFSITDVDAIHIQVSIPGNATVSSLRIRIDEIKRLLEADREFTKVKEITEFFGKTFARQAYSYLLVLYKEILSYKGKESVAAGRPEALKKYVFIIDEINRGEISKILGELFFSIDPTCRGEAGAVSTQYANLHADPEEKFYIPENVYIIGTMNDIDRSVDTFDFAMRRRFRFIEIKADENLVMLNNLGAKKTEAIRRMQALNKKIEETDGLNENYQIGAAYFKKLECVTFDQLWTDYLQPLLQEYVNGMYKSDLIMREFEEAYGYMNQNAELTDDDAAAAPEAFLNDGDEKSVDYED